MDILEMGLELDRNSQRRLCLFPKWIKLKAEFCPAYSFFYILQAISCIQNVHKRLL